MHKPRSKSKDEQNNLLDIKRALLQLAKVCEETAAMIAPRTTTALDLYAAELEQIIRENDL